MESDNVGRIAFVGILGVIGAVAITKPDLNGQMGVKDATVSSHSRENTGPRSANRYLFTLDFATRSVRSFVIGIGRDAVSWFRFSFSQWQS